MTYSPYLDTTAHDAAHQRQLDREGLREAWIDRRAQEIRDTLMSPSPDSGLDECLREMMDPALATVIREVAQAYPPERAAWRMPALGRRLNEVVTEYAYIVATNEADAER